MSCNRFQEQLLEFAKIRCVPFIAELENIKPYRSRIAFVLVGSVATGLCREDSDVDIALVCDEDVYTAISRGTRWTEGKPTEIILDGTQLHYYGITIQRIEEKMHKLNDVFLYVYTQTIVLEDASGIFKDNLCELLSSNDIRKQRTEGKLDMLLRRSNALEHCIKAGDPVSMAAILLEIIVLCLKVIALLDRVPFNPRKRLFSTAVSGPLGMRLSGDIRGLFGCFSIAEKMGAGNDVGVSDMNSRLHDILDILCREAAKQGFSTGLSRPDMRCREN